MLFIGIIISSLSGNSEKEHDLPDKVDFNYDIRPILSQNCFVCHGPDSSTRKANLRLDNFEGATAHLEHGGAAIVPGNISKSLLVDRISSEDPEFHMPPPEAKKTLSAREVALMKRWIDQGAKWKPHWAFIKPELPDLPDDIQEASVSEVIDHLIDRELIIKQLEPAPSAKKNALIRRVSYLLTGLPPDPVDVMAFIADTSADNYEKMVDQYLSSPQYGERWARHWMDLVRYGEYKGHEFDFAISGAWQYRDYLIRAFNQDVHYDLLVKEHLAGDMLTEPRYNPEEGFNESIIGTAYFFLGEGKHSPVNVKVEEYERIDNMIDVTSKLFQALTVGCARCHDHKFDPIPTTDYYAMYGMIESSRIGPLPARKTQKQVAQIEELKKIQKEIKIQLGAQFTDAVNEATPQFISQLQQFVKNADDIHSSENDSANYRVIGDFRQGDWKGWYTTGWAFGETPLRGTPVFDKQSRRVSGLVGGIASSRYFKSGVMGVLRSPNFIIEHDSIAIRARGINGTIRIIADNFQIIRYPLYGNLEKKLNSELWETYTSDLSLIKGHKAYLEFMPGIYGELDPEIEVKNSTRHIYSIKPQDYIEVQYAVAFDGEFPDLPFPVLDDQYDFSVKAKTQSISDWKNNQANTEQILLLNHWLKETNGITYPKALSELLTTYDGIAAQLYDSTHFLGLSEGDAVFSPVFIRGSIDKLSENKVPRQFLTAVKTGLDSFPQYGSGRLAWAESVVDTENPLTARVMVNRIWHHLFGKGIVETVDNFGLQGKLPSHPELLDYLAYRFIEEGWSIKQMIKHILLSQTFQRSTTTVAENQKIDPGNILLQHFPVRRLEAEAIRDGILSVTQNLDLTMYGESIPIHLTEFMTGRGMPSESGPLDGGSRRSIYIAVRRNFLSPMLLAFDMPIPFSTFGKRNTTNVPAQSLSLMNDPFVHQQAMYWAENLLRQKDVTISERINEIYIRAFSRQPSVEDLRGAETLLENLAKEYSQPLEEMKNDPQFWADYCHTIFNMKEFIHLL